MPFPLPNFGNAGEPMQFTIVPASGATPAKLIIKNTQNMWIYNGTTLTEVIDVDYPATTVWGVAYLDGTVYVMDSQGKISGSDILDPASWNALNFISANNEGDRGVAITRHLSYVIAFKERSIEVFYDAGNPAPGSPLSKMTNAFMEVGCAASGSIAYNDNTVYFMSNSFPKGRSIAKMDGLSPTYISTQYIDRILNADDLANVWAFTVKINGHVFYVLTLKTSAITLVFDEITREWHKWTYSSPNASVSCTTSLDAGTGITTVTRTAHGLSDGDPILIESQRLSITYLTANTFSVVAPVALAASSSYVSYTETYFPAIYYTKGSGSDLLLSETGAKVYEFLTTTYSDDGNPIDCHARTALTDWGVMTLKRVAKLELVGDLEDTIVNLRYTDDDYRTWSQYRPIEVLDNRAQLYNLGSTRRRAHELRHTENTPLRMLAIEVDIHVGAR